MSSSLFGIVCVPSRVGNNVLGLRRSVLLCVETVSVGNMKTDQANPWRQPGRTAAFCNAQYVGSAVLTICRAWVVRWKSDHGRLSGACGVLVSVLVGFGYVGSLVLRLFGFSSASKFTM